MKQRLAKVISSMLVVAILYANSAAVISYAADSLLSDKELENQKTQTNNSNVEFDAYYEGGKHKAYSDVNSSDTKLNLELNVKDAGYLKDITVSFAGSNFNIVDDGSNADKIQRFDSENKVIAFNQIDAGNTVVKKLTIVADKSDVVSEDVLGKDNDIVLNAVYVNKDGKEIAINKAIKLNASWKTDDAKAKLSYEITKYIPYSVGNTNKIITQAKVTSGVQDSVLPIKETNIEIVAPKINNENPESATVVANSTIATNGEEKAESFGQDNYSYDSTTGLIKINVKNDAKDGKIAWSKNTLDEYVITYVYSSNAYNATKDQVTRVTYEANSKIALYNCGTGVTSLTARTNGYEDQAGKLGEIVDFNFATTTELNKGYMYTNKVASDENKKETEFETTMTASISFADVVDSLELTQKEDSFKNESQNIVATGSIYNKTLTISKTEFNKILGENGQVTILNSNGETVQTINKDTATTGDDIVVDLSNNKLSTISIVTTKPIANGNISFKATKVVAKDAIYSEAQIGKFAKLTNSYTGVAKNEGITIVTSEKTSDIELKEPTHKASITTNRDTLSTIVDNKDFKITVTLENDSIDDKLYTNPKITVKLPKQITNITGTAQVSLDDELTMKVEDTKFTDNSDGTKSIEIQLHGTQTKYNNFAAKGATVVISTDITLDNLTPSTDTQIGLLVEDGDGTSVESSKAIQYVAPTGVVTTNTVSGYKDGAQDVMSISGEQKEALIPTASAAQTPTFTMNVINNYDATLKDIVVLGRIPFAGNKDIATNADLGSNINLNLNTGVSVTGNESGSAKVYYSTNGDATKDLSNTANGWTESTDNIANAKSYMIVFNNYEMVKGSTFTFSYKTNLPANLEHNKSAYENYVVYYNNGDTSDSTTATKVGVTTGSGAVISAKLENITGTDTIANGEIIKYRLTVENTGTESAQGLKVTMPLLSSMSYVVEDTETILGYKVAEGLEVIQDDQGNTAQQLNITLEDVNAHSTLTKEIWILTDTSESEEKFETKATVSNGDVKAETNSVSISLTKVDYIAQVVSSTDNVNTDDTFRFTMFVRSSDANISTDDDGNEVYNGSRQNSVISMQLPAEFTLDNVKIDDEDKTSDATVSNGKLSINIGTVGYNKVAVAVTLKAKMVDANVYEKQLSITPTIKGDSTVEQSMKTVNVTINKPGLEVKQTSSVPAGTPIKAGEVFNYTFTIKNLANTVISDINFTDILPENVLFSNLQLKIGENTTVSAETDDNKNPIVNIGMLEGKQEATVIINAVAGRNTSDTKISNKAEIKNAVVGTITSNTVENTIKGYNPTGKDDEIVPVDKETRMIAGVVWIDKNQNGERDSDEQLVNDVEVMLLDNSTGDIAVDSNGNKLTTKTDGQGAYAFNNVKQGRYTVIFFYDSANYSVTDYKKQGVDETKNSDAIEKDVILYEEKSRKAGVTDEIVLSTSNVYNVDLGLVEDKKFDLKLDKIITNITVNDKKGTTEHSYNKNFAKIDFESKYADSSTMIVEYKITVTNEGAIPGYAKKIADYLPAELKFSTELNQDWYEGKDGAIYNNSLANTVINPGESKEIKLILTKAMTKESFGTITNNAEIYEASNDYGVKDTDSTPGNKLTNEDDYSTATVVTGVKTGQIFIYTTLAITVIAIIGVGGYMVKKRVLK